MFSFEIRGKKVKRALSFGFVGAFIEVLYAPNSVSTTMLLPQEVQSASQSQTAIT